MFCGNCGSELTDDCLFCPNCGAKVDADDIEQHDSEQENAYRAIEIEKNIGTIGGDRSVNEDRTANDGGVGNGESSGSFGAFNRPFLFFVVGVVLLIGIVVVFINGVAVPESISGKYTTNNLGLPISGYEFFPDGSVIYYCAGFENSYGWYTAKGNKYELTIDEVGQDSYYVYTMEEIRDYCKIIVTPVDEYTIDVEIKAKASDEIYLGQLGKERYTRE